MGPQPPFAGEQLSWIATRWSMRWRPLTARDYMLAVLAGILLGALVAGVAVWAASVTA